MAIDPVPGLHQPERDEIELPAVLHALSDPHRLEIVRNVSFGVAAGIAGAVAAPAVFGAVAAMGGSTLVAGGAAIGAGTLAGAGTDAALEFTGATARPLPRTSSRNREVIRGVEALPQTWAVRSRSRRALVRAT